MASIFSRIIAREIPSHKIWEDDAHYAFLDINPIQPGHTLIVPKDEVDYIFDMTPEAYTALWDAVRTVEGMIRAATGCKRVVIEVVGWEVPHVHVHLIPTNELADYPIPPRQETDHEELAKVAKAIRPD